MKQQDFDTFERMQKFKQQIGKIKEYIRNPQAMPNQIGTGGDYAMSIVKDLKCDLEHLLDEYYSKAIDIQEDL